MSAGGDLIAQAVILIGGQRRQSLITFLIPEKNAAESSRASAIKISPLTFPLRFRALGFSCY